MVLLKQTFNLSSVTKKKSLHSTMVLLKHIVIITKSIMIPALHSTMVLLKLTVGKEYSIYMPSFTFHYGLIKTIFFDFLFIICTYLYIPLWSY